MSRRMALAVLLLVGCTRPPTVDHTLLVSCPASFLPAMQALGAGYSKIRPQCRVLGNGGGSTAAILAVRRGAVDLSVSARDLTLQEDDHETHAYLLARVGLGVIVNQANPVDNISLPKLLRVMKGEITDWSALGGPAGPITVVLGPDQNRLGVSDSIEIPQLDREHATHAESSEKVVQTVEGNARALGFLPWSVPSKSARVLKVAEVPFSAATMTSARYPLSRSLFLVRHGDSAFEEQGFADYCLGPEGQGILAAQGYLPIR